MRIIITGTPGTGKSTVANLLGKQLERGVVHVSEFAKKEKLITGRKTRSNDGSFASEPIQSINPIF